jgi:hypothetical protein
VSGGISNHAGPGSRRALVEVTNDLPLGGTARSPVRGTTARERGLPDDAERGAGFFYGFENENLGDELDPWPPVQFDAMVEASATLCRAHCWTPDRIIGHAEWTSRKPDPLGFTMADFRARVRDALR